MNVPTIDQRILNRLQGLLALTASNNVHEAQSAQAKLEALCKKYGIDILDLCNQKEEKEIYWFRYDNANSKTILLQTSGHVLGADADSYYVNRNKQSCIGFEITKSQAAEFGLWWSVLRAAFKEHEKASTLAFIHANKLYDTRPADPAAPQRELTDVDRAALAMSRNITPTQVNKALSYKG